MTTEASRLLDNRDFRKLWMGQSISELGSRITRDALPIIAVSLLNATPTQMGLLNAAASAPVLLFGLFVGVWVDRQRRRPLMIAADSARLFLLLLLPLAYLGGWLGLPLVFLVAALMNILGLLFETAYRALLPTLVTPPHLLEANSKLSTTDAVAEIGGPALTGILVQVLTAPMAILFDSLSYLVSISNLARIRSAEPPPPPRDGDSSTWRDIRAGVQALREDAIVRSIAVTIAMRAFFGAGIGTLYDILVLRELGFSPALLGLLVATGGIGALGGALLAETLPRRMGVGRALVGTLLVNGVLTLTLPLSALLPALALPLLVAAQIIGDGAMMIFWVNSLSLRQMRTPNHLLGRVNAGIGFLAEGIAPIGAVVAGVLASAIGTTAVLWLIAAGMLATGIVAALSPLGKGEKI